jgi:hypothetical protein
MHTVADTGTHYHRLQTTSPQLEAPGQADDFPIRHPSHGHKEHMESGDQQTA